MKKEVITAFISRYHVTPQQAAVLKRSDQMDPEFFTVLDRVKSIHQDCKILLQTHQTTGLQIMENMAHLQEQAFQTLFKWTQVLIILFTSDPANNNFGDRQLGTSDFGLPPVSHHMAQSVTYHL